MERTRTPAQFGGLPGRPLSLPCAYVRAHLANLQHRSVSGGRVFLDVRSAYYSIIRDLVTSTASQRCDADMVRRRAAELFSYEELRDRFIDLFTQGNLLESCGASPATTAFFQAHLRCTWYAVRRDATTAFQSSSRTAPGSHMLFGLLFSQFLDCLQQRLRSLGLNAVATWATEEGTCLCHVCDGQPTWADDLAVLFQVGSAHEVTKAIRSIAEEAEKGLTQLGLAPNFTANKSEALPVFHGAGSRAAKRDALSASQPTVEFQTLEGRTESIRLVQQYTHLGSVIRHDLSEIPFFRQREAHMYKMYRPLRAKIPGNDFLTLPEKAHLIRERVLSRFIFGSGLWRLATSHEAKVAEDPINKVIRGSLKASAGLSSQGLSTLQCAALQGLPTARELFVIERARTACELAKHSPAFVWRALLNDQVWIQLAMRAVEEVMKEVGFAWDSSLGPRDFPSAVRGHDTNIRKACSSFARLRISARPREDFLPKPYAAPHCVLISDSEDEPVSGLAKPFQCHCAAGFFYVRLLAVHKARVHRITAPLTAACFGTRCERCGIEYWE